MSKARGLGVVSWEEKLLNSQLESLEEDDNGIFVDMSRLPQLKVLGV